MLLIVKLCFVKTRGGKISVKNLGSSSDPVLGFLITVKVAETQLSDLWKNHLSPGADGISSESDRLFSSEFAAFLLEVSCESF